QAIVARMGPVARSFEAYDEALVDLITLHRKAFEQAIRDGDEALGGWNIILPGVLVAAMLLIGVGVGPRLSEYRRGADAMNRKERVMRVRLAAVAAAVALAAAGCGLGGGQPPSILDKETLVVGVKPDQPGLGLLKNGRYEGFDVDVARYVTRKLGFTDVRFTSAPSARREEMLQRGEVDLILASCSITPERLTKVGFAGPYYVAHQDTLVRASDTQIGNVRDLQGKRLCQVTGSNSWKRVMEEREVAVNLVKADSYSDCVEKLKAGQVDAVST